MPGVNEIRLFFFFFDITHSITTKRIKNFTHYEIGYETCFIRFLKLFNRFVVNYKTWNNLRFIVVFM